MNETIEECTYPEKLYYVCFELEFEILELQKIEEFNYCCSYKSYKYDNAFEVGIEDIIEYAKVIAEEDGEEFEESQDFSLTYDGAKQIAITYLKQQVAELRNDIIVIKNKITSLEKN